jgi:signal transduction histidine kinase
MSLWVEVAAFTSFGLTLGAVAWWTWAQRQAVTRKLDDLGREVQGIAHDLNNLVMLIPSNTRAAREAEPGELPDILLDLDNAAETVSAFAKVLRGSRTGEPGTVRSAVPLVRKAAALARAKCERIDLGVRGDIRFRGHDEDALRLVLNLLLNAAAEVRHLPRETVQIEVGRGSLRVTNRVRDPGAIDGRMFEPGTSGTGSSGLGLPIVADLALRVGWTLRHEVVGAKISFVLEERPAELSAA